MDTALTDQQLAEQAGQDGLIAARLPAWLKKLDKAFITQAGQALNSSLKCRQRLAARWGLIEGIDAFAKPLLEKSLSARFGIARAWTSCGFGTLTRYRSPLISRYGCPCTNASTTRSRCLKPPCEILPLNRRSHRSCRPGPACSTRQVTRYRVLAPLGLPS
ncbi:hypothetical protein GTA26_29095 [Rhodococcus hoagii]|nr:hypothetical protein [Prescottella equi]